MTPGAFLEDNAGAPITSGWGNRWLAGFYGKEGRGRGNVAGPPFNPREDGVVGGTPYLLLRVFLSEHFPQKKGTRDE